MKKVMALCFVLSGLLLHLSAQIDSTARPKNHLDASPMYIGLGASIPFGFSVTGGATFCSPNYTYKIVERNSIGWSIKGKLGVNITKVVEFEISLLSNLNPRWYYFGLEFLETLGVFGE